MKIINWVSSASEVIATWASLHNSLYFYMFDIVHGTTLKKKEGDTGLWVVLPISVSITQNWADGLHYLDLWPPDKDSQRPQRSLQSIFHSLGQANKVWGPPDEMWPLWENPLWGSSSYILILNQIEDEISRRVEKNQVVKNFCEIGMKQWLAAIKLYYV